MARSVLGHRARWVGSLVLATGFFMAPAHGTSQTAACSSKNLGPDIQALQQRILEGTFYKELLRRFGKPLTCGVDVQDGRINLNYTFPHRAQLIALTDTRIEFSEQRVELIRMDRAKAMALLRRAELDFYPPRGCGISWKSGEEKSASAVGGRRETVYRSDTCNCQAHLICEGNNAVILFLRTAC